MHVKKGMLVKVVSGNHKGMEGKILNVFPKKTGLLLKVSTSKNELQGLLRKILQGDLSKEKPHCTFLMLWLLIMVRRQE